MLNLAAAPAESGEKRSSRSLAYPEENASLLVSMLEDCRNGRVGAARGLPAPAVRLVAGCSKGCQQGKIVFFPSFRFPISFRRENRA
jgi:hypothetical protein